MGRTGHGGWCVLRPLRRRARAPALRSEQATERAERRSAEQQGDKDGVALRPTEELLLLVSISKGVSRPSERA